MRESYYAIVNGYKTPFLDKQAMKAHSNDRFLAGTEFEWIFVLYSFDRDLRSLVFQFLDKAEATMQNAVTYAFCKKKSSGRLPRGYQSPRLKSRLGGYIYIAAPDDKLCHLKRLPD